MYKIKVNSFEKIFVITLNGSCSLSYILPFDGDHGFGIRFAGAVFFSACGVGEASDGDHNTEQGGEDPEDGNKPGADTP